MNIDAIRNLAAFSFLMGNGEPNPLLVLAVILVVLVVGYGVLFALIWSHSP